MLKAADTWKIRRGAVLRMAGAICTALSHFPTLPVVLLLCSLAFGARTTHAQGLMSDLMSGKLVNPEVGAFAWYSLKDTASGREFFLRQAIVGEERIKRKTAYWLETELVPRVGYSSVYKMLLTGPASNPKNVHRLLVREGTEPVQEVNLDEGERGGGDEEAARELVGTETISIPTAEIEAEHFVVGEGDERAEIWVSEEVAPMGLVKMTTKLGELMLQRYGVGGKDGESAIASPTPQQDEVDDTAEEAPQTEKRVETNFGVRRGGRR